MSESSKHWIAEIDQISHTTEHLLKDLDEVQLMKRPTSQSWSIAENLQHLIQVNRSYFPIFDKLKNGTLQTAFVGKFGFFTRLFGNILYQSVNENRAKKIKTFPLWEPRITEEGYEVLAKFLSHQEDLKKKIKELEPYILQEKVIHSPANKLIVYTLPRALDIIVEHEKRHLAQCAEILTKI